jgi:hypothetical protein
MIGPILEGTFRPNTERGVLVVNPHNLVYFEANVSQRRANVFVPEDALKISQHSSTSQIEGGDSSYTEIPTGEHGLLPCIDWLTEKSGSLPRPETLAMPCATLRRPLRFRLCTAHLLRTVPGEE